jgi:hypothetical protein
MVSGSRSTRVIKKTTLVSAMDCEPLGFLTTEMRVPKLHRCKPNANCTHRGNGGLSEYGDAPAVYTQYGTPQPSVCPRAHITLWETLHLMIMYQPVTTFPNAVLQHSHNMS